MLYFQGELQAPLLPLLSPRFLPWLEKIAGRGLLRQMICQESAFYRATQITAVSVPLASFPYRIQAQGKGRPVEHRTFWRRPLSFTT